MKQWLDRVVQGRWSRPAFAAVAVVGAALAVSPSAAWQVVTQVGRFLAAYPVTVVLLVAVAVALVDQARRTDRRKPVAGRWPWLLSDRGIFVVVGVMACVGAAVIAIMLVLAHTVDGVERTKLQLDAIKYGLGVIAAAGGVAALLLSVRRQRHTEEDAEEQRMTDIYTAAVEQLGHAEAPVRLGGMYALERLAQANPSQRQTVVNVLCAYLRMPFTPPDDMARPQAEADKGEMGNRLADGVRDPQQELQVRLTAQRILTQHLRRPEGVSTIAEAGEVYPSPKQPFWPNIDLDLTGAFLSNFTFNECHTRHASFQAATFGGVAGVGAGPFGGVAGFGGATFAGRAVFAKAEFGGGAWFAKAEFGGGAAFGRATFGGFAWFENAVFGDASDFDEAAFGGDVRFAGAVFREDVRLIEAKFGGGADFDEVAFGGEVGFDLAAFGDDVRFAGATFHGDARFVGATFSGEAWFDLATFGGGAWFDVATFCGDARFDEARFGGFAWFDKATIGGDAWFTKATFGDAWFTATTFGCGAWFESATFRGDVRFTEAKAAVGGRHHLPDGWSTAGSGDAGWLDIIRVPQGMSG